MHGFGRVVIEHVGALLLVGTVLVAHALAGESGLAHRLGVAVPLEVVGRQPLCLVVRLRLSAQII